MVPTHLNGVGRMVPTHLNGVGRMLQVPTHLQQDTLQTTHKCNKMQTITMPTIQDADDSRCRR